MFLETYLNCEKAQTTQFQKSYLSRRVRLQIGREFGQGRRRREGLVSGVLPSGGQLLAAELGPGVAAVGFSCGRTNGVGGLQLY